MKNRSCALRALAVSVLAGVFSLVLAGCGTGSTAAPPVQQPPNGYAGLAFAGKILAGQVPIKGASVQLYAAGTAGLGSAGVPLLTTALTSDSNGAFNVPAGYSCPLATSQLYLIARGGTASATSSTPNAASTLMTALGSCNGTPSASAIINEATTVAAAYALAQFFSTGGNIGASSTNSVGLANAFATAGSLVGTLSGISPGPAFPANGVAPTARIDSLANLLNACVITTGGAASGSACGQLFLSSSPAGTAPGNTLDAIVSIVRNPGANVATLYTQSTASSAFKPSLAAAPADWTLFLTFSGGGMNGPSGLGLDAAGNLWVASYFSAATQFSPLGKVLATASGSGLENSYGLAVDASNDVWIPNEQSPAAVNGGLGSVTVLNSTGQALSGASGYTAGGLNFPISVAIDPNSDAWIVDYGNSHLTLLTSGGQPLSGAAGYTTSLFAFPVAVAVDANHNAWIANQTGSAITKASADGTQFTNVSCCNGASGLAIDRQGNVWVANYYGDSVSQVSSSGTVISSGYIAPSIYHPQGIAVDGSGSVWVANYRGPSISELAGASATSPGASLSPSAGWAPDASLLEAFAIGIDASGNLWVTNFGSNTVTELVGLASPVKTPLIGPVQTP